MKRNAFSSIIGLGLITLGALFLLQSLGVIDAELSLIWVVLFAAGGITFLYFYYLNREQWWAVIPGFSMLGIAAVIVAAEYGPTELENVAGGIFMLSVGLSFLFIYLRNREMWWSVIVTGFCLTIGIMIISEPLFQRNDLSGAIFFLGGALTFGIIGILPTSNGRLNWAFFPAVGMLGIGGMILASAFEAFQVFGAVALILVGTILILRIFTRREIL
jgi:hypothetical protein